VYLPSGPRAPERIGDSQVLAKLASEGRDKPLPVVIFLHGCGGYQPDYVTESAYPEVLAKAGYAVFVPNSYARGPSRKSDCGYVRMNTVVLMRSDVDDAVKRILQLQRIDRRNLFLAGHSEGAIATTMYSGYEFNAYFISAWPCKSENAEFDRIHVPANRPVLAVLGENDEAFPMNKGHANCGNRMAGRPGSISIVVPHRGHDGVAADPAVQATLVDFFNRDLSK